MVDSTTRTPDGRKGEAARVDAAPRLSALPRPGRTLPYLLLGAVFIGAAFWQMQFATDAICCGDYDGYYHTRWSRLLWEGARRGQFPPPFVWLPLTTLAPDTYVDHHLLFHVLQIPFTWFADLRHGAKVGAWLFSVLGILSCYWLVLRYRLSAPVLWLLALFAASGAFLYRMNMTKAMSLSLVLMIAGIVLLFERRYVWLAPLAFLYVWTYSLWVLLGVAAVTWVGVLWWSEGRVEWRALAWAALGVVAGFVVNPYFPHNVALFYEHLIIKATLGNFTADVGGEWYPFDTWKLFKSCLGAFVAMLVGYVAFNARDRRAAQRPLFFLVFSTLLLLMTARSNRWVEYWPPFAVIFAAFSLQAYRAGTRADAAPTEASEAESLPPRALFRRHAGQLIVGAVLLAMSVGNVLGIARGISESDSPRQYLGGMEWIRANVPPGEIIFNSDWDDFPKIFYHDPTHRYVSGLDPTYLLDKDRELSELYVNITLGREKDPGPLIRDRFGSRYIFTDNLEIHDALYDNALDSGWFEEVYSDEECTVLRLLDVRRPPAPEEAEGEGR